MIKVTKQNFDKIVEAYVTHIIDSMDLKTLTQFATEQMYQNVSNYTLMDLEEEINQFYTDLTEIGLDEKEI